MARARTTTTKTTKTSSIPTPESRKRRSRRLVELNERESKRQQLEKEPPSFSFGVIADIQYANIPDGHSYAGVPRYYRNSAKAARNAAQHFEKEKVPIVLNLGDIVDGKCQELIKYGGDPLPEGADAGLVAVDDVMEALTPYQSGPILHTYGNHELYNLDRTTLGKRLGIAFVKEANGDLVGYRSLSMNGIRFVVLDTYDINILRRCPNESSKHQKAVEYLSTHNPNFPEQENSPQGLNGLKKRFVAFNGAVDEPQLEWLRTTLEEARQAGEKVVVLSHQPILPGSASPMCIVWNYNDVLDVLREYGDIIMVSFAGHAHKGGYKRDPYSGIHFRVIEAVLENPSPNDTYGLVDMYSDRMVVRGYGNCTSSVYDLSHVGGFATKQPLSTASKTEAETETKTKTKTDTTTTTTAAAAAAGDNVA